MSWPTSEDVIDAARIDEPNAAIKRLQDIAGVKTGDVAGQFFSDYDDLDIFWEHATLEERIEALTNYLQVEATFEEHRIFT